MNSNAQSVVSGLGIVARVCVAFVVGALISCFIEIILWMTKWELAILVPLAAYVLGSMRFFPKGTPTMAAFSHGAVVGTFVPVLLYLFGYSFWMRVP